mgnify:CR=1 FL=1
MVKKEDFFTGVNCATCVSEDEYAKLPPFIEAFDAVARTTYKSIYVIDYHRQNFLYVSDNPFYLCGMTAEEVQELGYDFYLKFVPESEHELLLEANCAGFQFAESIPPERWSEYTISYDFHICPPQKTPILINHKITPLKMSSDGHLWLAFCIASLSAAPSSGNIEVTNFRNERLWAYRNNQWKEEQIILTKREQDVVYLLVQRETIKGIAQKLYRAEDTVKLYQKSLYKKLKVKNRVGAVLCILNKRII